MKLTKPFLSSSVDSLSLNDYRRIRKICDDANYYNMHTIDYALMQSGALLVRNSMWPELNVVKRLSSNGRTTLSKNSVILNYYKDELLPQLKGDKYDASGLKAMKVFSDIMFYANDPGAERLNLLKDIKDTVKSEENPELWVYTFCRIPLEKYDEESLFDYHPAFYESSLLYQMTDLDAIYQNDSGFYLLKPGKNLLTAKQRVYDSLRNFPSFDINKVQKTYSSEEDELYDIAFMDSDGYYPERNVFFRVMLDDIADRVWKNGELRNDFKTNEDIMIRYAVGQLIKKDYLLRQKDGKYIFDPNIKTDSIPNVYESMPYKLSDFCKYDEDGYIDQLSDQFMSCVHKAASEGRLPRLDYNIVLSPRTLDIATTYFKKPEIYKKAIFIRNLWNFTNRQEQNSYKDLDLSDYALKDYDTVLSRNRYIELISDIPSIPMTQDEAREEFKKEADLGSEAEFDYTIDDNPVFESITKKMNNIKTEISELSTDENDTELSNEPEL